jgi:hypothetical protein
VTESSGKPCSESNGALLQGKPPKTWRPMAVWTAGILALYVGSHLALSRCSASRLREANIECFLYVPCRVESLRDHRSLWSLHRVMTVVYAPAWLVDHHLFGGPPPMMYEPMWGLSSKADEAEK